jgi:hypothetical protein
MLRSLRTTATCHTIDVVVTPPEASRHVSRTSRRTWQNDANDSPQTTGLQCWKPLADPRSIENARRPTDEFGFNFLHQLPNVSDCKRLQNPSNALAGL